MCLTLSGFWRFKHRYFTPWAISRVLKIVDVYVEGECGVHVTVWTHEYACGPESRTGRCVILCDWNIALGLDLSLDCRFLFSTRCLASQLSESTFFSPTPDCWGYTHVQPCWVSCVGAGIQTQVQCCRESTLAHWSILPDSRKHFLKNV